MATLSIGEAARTTGFAASTLRYYERVGLIDPPPRVSGRRTYGREHVDQLDVIRVAREAGLSLSQLRELLGRTDREGRPSVRWGAVTRRRLAEVDEEMCALEAKRRCLEELARCRCRSLRRCAQEIRARRLVNI